MAAVLNGRMIILLALMLIVGAVGVVFYSVGQWKMYLSESIVTIPKPALAAP